MFDEEAIEKARDIYTNFFGDIVAYPEILKAISVGVQKGAEFGYNKANEWHILAEEPDVLPKEGQILKVLTEDNVIQKSTYFYDDYFEGMAFSNVGLVKVLAWKEIALPELKEGCLHETEDKKKNDF